MDKILNIALCTDENFVVPALVCITSIFENNKDYNCQIHVLTGGVSQKSRDKFSKLGEIYDQKINIIQIDDSRFDGLIYSSHRYPRSMYYRFLLPEMLPDVNTILYLDCDIMVRKGLNELFDVDISNKALGCVVSQSCDNILWATSLIIQSPYFNSGVLLMNLDYWRHENLFRVLVKWIEDNSDKCMLPDQNALNKILEGKVVYLDYGYNFQERWTRSLEGSYVAVNKWAGIVKAGKNPTIVHFCENEKPWFEECVNPFKEEYYYYAQLHDFVGFHVQKRYGKEYMLAVFLDRIGLKIRYWAERWQKHALAKIKVS